MLKRRKKKTGRGGHQETCRNIKQAARISDRNFLCTTGDNINCVFHISEAVFWSDENKVELYGHNSTNYAAHDHTIPSPW